MSSLTYSGNLTIMTCWCGTRHAVPAELAAFQQREHDNGDDDVRAIYCPLGHQHVPAGKGAAERLREQVAAEQRRVTRLRAELDQSDASRRALKGVVTRTKRRAAHGVCPGCHRTFANVAAHVANKHPDLIADTALEGNTP